MRVAPYWPSWRRPVCRRSWFPAPWSDDQAQTANAKAMERQGGCVMLDEQAAEPLEAQLARWLSQLLHNDIRRAQMAQAMRATACPNAAEQIATLCVETFRPGDRSGCRLERAQR